MGNTIMIPRNINFEDMQIAINEQNKGAGNMHSQAHDNAYANKSCIIINTLEPHNQHCLISGTLNINSEVEMINVFLKKNKNICVIIYGVNAADSTTLKKYEQLVKLGFYNTHIYAGGLFEWLLLQDVYGMDLFPTTSKVVDILKYKGRQYMNVKMLE